MVKKTSTTNTPDLSGIRGEKEEKLMPTEAQLRAKRRYRSKCKSLTVEFCPTESFLFAQVEKQANKSAYIKRLIQEDMDRGTKNERS